MIILALLPLLSPLFLFSEAQLDGGLWLPPVPFQVAVTELSLCL